MKPTFVIKYQGKYFTGKIREWNLQFASLSKAKRYDSREHANYDLSLSHPVFGSLWADGPKIVKV